MAVFRTMYYPLYFFLYYSLKLLQRYYSKVEPLYANGVFCECIQRLSDILCQISPGVNDNLWQKNQVYSQSSDKDVIFSKVDSTLRNLSEITIPSDTLQ
jgi:hypothetical protein